MKMIKTAAVLAYLSVGCAADAWQDSIDSLQATTDADNILLPAYTNCITAGIECGLSTTCGPVFVNVENRPDGNICTIRCATSAMCPRYITDSRDLQIECIAPPGRPELAQCMRVCNPANHNRDCAPFFTTCAAVSIVEGRIYVCVP